MSSILVLPWRFIHIRPVAMGCNPLGGPLQSVSAFSAEFCCFPFYNCCSKLRISLQHTVCVCIYLYTHTHTHTQMSSYFLQKTNKIQSRVLTSSSISMLGDLLRLVVQGTGFKLHIKGMGLSYTINIYSASFRFTVENEIENCIIHLR